MPDEILADRYRLVRRLGEGGMGEVWEGRDETLERPVAVKLISTLAGGGSRGDEIRARFLREARLTARLQHPAIVTLHDLGSARAAEGDTPFLVMELLRGEGLDAVLRRGPVAPADAAPWGAQICAALGEAHAGGVLHRDIKPANIFLTSSGALKVLDFGIARAADPSAADDRVTQTGFVVGTPQYMAPEQARERAEPASDLYALGCVLFEMLTGRLPFEGTDAMSHLSAHLTEPPPAPGSVASGIPPGWDDLVLTLLRKDPAERYASAAAVAEALRALAEPGRPAGIPGYTPTAVDTAAPAAAGAEPRTSGGGPRAAAAPPEPFTPDLVTGFMVERPVLGVSFAPDGERLALVLAKGILLVTDLTGRERLRIQLSRRTLYGLPAVAAFSPDGSRLVTLTTDDSLQFWDAATGRLLRRLGQAHQQGPLSFSPDGSLLALAGQYDKVRLRDARTGETVAEPEKPPTLHRPFYGAVLSPDGARVAVTSVGNVVLIPVRGQAQEPLTIAIPPTKAALDADFSPDGTMLVTAQSTGHPLIWGARSGEQLRPLPTLKGASHVRFSPDGAMVATGGRGNVGQVWAAATGVELFHISYRTRVSVLAFSPDGGTLVSTSKRHVQLWRLAG